MDKNSIAVVTANIGGYDILRPPVEVSECACYYCHTDGVGSVVPPWSPYILSRVFNDPTRESRRVKIGIHRHIHGFEYSIYQDASFQMLARPEWLIETFLASADIAFYTHPHRKNAAQEAKACIDMHLDDPNVIKKHMSRYNDPASLPLLSGGIILRRHTKSVELFNQIWWDEYLSGSRRDQLSLGYALLESKVKYNVIDRDYFFTNPYFKYYRHEKKREAPV